MTPRHPARITESHGLELVNKDAFRLWLLTFKPGTRVAVTVKKYRKKRTDPQNRYYWGVVVETIRQHCGYEKEEMHENLKRLHASSPDPNYLAIPNSTRHLVRIESTARMSTERFSEYIEDVKRWAAVELGVYVPDAEEVE